MNTLLDYKHSTDLAALIASDLGQEPKRSGKWMTFSCPFPGHKHNDKGRSLCVVNPNGAKPGYWKCYGCHRNGSAVDWMMQYRNMTIKDVAAYVRGEGPLPSALVLPEALIQAPTILAQWQDRAHGFMTECKEVFWRSPQAAPARDYLFKERKFSESMVNTWDLGFNPTTYFDDKPVWGLPIVDGESRKMILRRGIVIPCFETGIVSYLKIRVLPTEQKDDERKYRKVSGSLPGIMGLDTVLNTSIVFATEGELNLLPLWEGINRLPNWYQIGAISFGSSSDYEALKPNAERFLPVKKIIAYFDDDNAGKKAKERLSEITGRVEFATLSTKDIADYHAAGNDVSAWVQYQIERAHIFAGELAF
jgi:hypothetical protein